MLSDPIFTIETRDGRVCADFPSCLAKLVDGSLLEFQGLAAHQRPAWLLFLYQTAALALVRSNHAALADDDAGWRTLADPAIWRGYLEALAPASAWELINPDPAAPALLQPPQGPGYTLLASTPDELDVLITSKNHDIKRARAAQATDADWLFALVSLQTMQAYSGRKSYGIARMSSRFASRPLVERVPDRTVAAQFRHGVRAALTARMRALVQPSLFSDNGVPLLWLVPWDGKQAFPIVHVDPLVVEICRRVRLVRDATGRITAFGQYSDTDRLAAPKEAKGNLGDAWTPIKADDDAALTVRENGFDYRLVSRLLNPKNFKLPVAATNTNPWLHLAVLARSTTETKTEGYHERWVRLPEGAREDDLGQISERMVEEAKAAKKALSMAVLTLLQGGPDKINFGDERPAPWLAAAEGAIDGMFFQHLRARAEAEDVIAAHEAWKRELCAQMRGVLERAIDQGISPPGLRRERARAMAWARFEGMLQSAELKPARQITAEPEEEFDDTLI